jgi:hypothetical protein
MVQKRDESDGGKASDVPCNLLGGAFSHGVILA